MMRVCLLLSVLVLVCGVTDPWMGTSPSDDWLVFPSTRTLTLFYSPSSLFISLSSHVMDVLCMFLFCSLSVLVSVCGQIGWICVFHYEQDLPRLSGRTTPCTALSLSLGSRSSRKSLQTSKHMHTKKVWLGLWMILFVVGLVVGIMLVC